MTPLTTSAFDLPDHLAAKADPALIAARRAALRRHRGEPGAVDRRPRPTASTPPAGRPGGTGQEAMDRDLEVHRLTARLRAAAPLRARPVPGPHGRARTTPEPGVRRPARPHRQRRAAGCSSTGAPRRPSRSSGRPTPTRWAWRSRRRYRWTRGPDQRLLGRGVHPGRARGARRARRPVGVHRQPGQQPVAPDARRARHHPGRPGRHHPRRLARRPRRRRRPGHRQDRRRAAPRRLPPLLRPAPRPPPGRRAVRRPAPALPGLRRRRAAQPRRGGRADLHPARPRPRGRRGAGPSPTPRWPG